jgi:hypothetical protein
MHCHEQWFLFQREYVDPKETKICYTPLPTSVLCDRTALRFYPGTEMKSLRFPYNHASSSHLKDYENHAQEAHVLAPLPLLFKTRPELLV